MTDMIETATKGNVMTQRDEELQRVLQAGTNLEQLINELCPEGVEFKTLGEIADLIRGNGLPKTMLTDSGVGAVHYGQIYTRYGIYADTTYSFVAPQDADKLVKVSPGDVIITNTSENIEDLGKALAWVGSEDIVIGGHATVLRSGLNPKFVSYFLRTPQFYAQKLKFATGTKVIELASKKLEKVKIPVPPVEVQEGIVRILDLFTELEAELEAELEKRRAQYSYYRDKLLSFNTLTEIDRERERERESK